MSAGPRALFFCGDRSRYGIAHLEPIAEHFDLRAIVVPDDARWRVFRAALTGGEASPCETIIGTIRRQLRKLVRVPLRMREDGVRDARLRLTGAQVIVVNDANASELPDRFRSLGVEVVLSAAYPQIFKTQLLRLAPRGVINFHPSLLPRCRGAHPHYWCLATGEESGGVTAHLMVERIDCGDIIAQRGFSLGGFYYEDLYARIVAETPPLVAEVRRFLDDPNAKPRVQDEAQATTFRNDRDIHHRIVWSEMTALGVMNRVRAGRAFAMFRGRRVVFARARCADERPSMTKGVAEGPGSVVGLDALGIWVATRDEKFVVIEALEGCRCAVAHRDWAAEHGLKIGERFG